MKKLQTKITKRFVAAMLVTAAVVGVSALAMQASTQNQNSLAPSLKSIQTDKATSFYAGRAPNQTWFVELALPGTSESRATTENLKVIATTL
jgi:putative copper export protein